MSVNPFDELSEKLERLEDKIEEIRQRGLDEIGVDKAKYLSLEGAAEFLHVAVTTMRGLAKNRKVPYFRQISKLYFKVSDLEAYIEQGRVDSVIRNPNVKQRVKL